MTLKEKKDILRKILENVDFIDEKDRPAIIAYIRGTSDTRERIVSENNSAKY